MLGVSLVIWLTAQIGFRFTSGNTREACGSILAAHSVLLAMLLMSGATGFLGALRSRPAAAWERGALQSLGLSAICLFGLFALNNPIRRMNNPTNTDRSRPGHQPDQRRLRGARQRHSARALDLQSYRGPGIPVLLSVAPRDRRRAYPDRARSANRRSNTVPTELPYRKLTPSEKPLPFYHSVLNSISQGLTEGDTMKAERERR